MLVVHLLKEFGNDVLDKATGGYGKIVLHSDSSGAIKWAKHPGSSQKHSKHVDVKYRFVCQVYEDGLVAIRHIASSDNPADIFTKPLSRKLLQRFCNRMHLED